jgi:hypothetical protein
MNSFPFPNKENSMTCLERDYVFAKIDSKEIPAIFEDAWTIGTNAAEDFLKDYPSGQALCMKQILQQHGMIFQNMDYDYVLGTNRYFCEYISNRKTIKIYQPSVELWCKENGFTYEDGLNVILCHEYFHYLETSKLGITSRRHLVPIVKIGNFRLGTTGIPSLSEIAANAFAEKCYARICGVAGE